MPASAKGLLLRDGDRYSIRFERYLQHPASVVWAALTRPSFLRLWFAEATVDLKPGGDYILDYAHDPAVMRGKITRLEEGKFLEYTWDENKLPGSRVSWELFEEGPEKCRLVMIHHDLQRRMPDLGAGWHAHIDLLEQVLNGERKEWSWDEQWWKGKIESYGTGS